MKTFLFVAQGQLAYLVYPQGDPEASQSSTSTSLFPMLSEGNSGGSDTLISNMELLYPLLGATQVQLQNQSQSVVNEVIRTGLK